MLLLIAMFSPLVLVVVMVPVRAICKRLPRKRETQPPAIEMQPVTV